MTKNISSKMWYLLLVGLLAVSFLWGAIKVFLSPAQLRTWIDEELTRQHLHVKVEYEQAETSFFDGIFPELAIVITNIRIQANDPCRTTSIIKAGSLRLPLQMGSLFSDRIRLGVLRISDGEFHWGPKLCTSSEPPSAETPGTSSSNALSAAIDKPKPPVESSQALQADTSIQIQNFIATRWAKELKRTAQSFSGLEFRRTRFIEGKNKKEWLRLIQSKVSIDPDDQTLHGHFLWRPGEALAGKESLGPIETDIIASDESLRVSVNGLIKEGSVQLKSHLDVASGSVNVNGSLKHIPGTVITGLFGQSSDNEFKVSSQLFWLTTNINFAGHVDRWRDQAINVENFAIEGEVGDIRLSEIHVYPFKEPQFLPFSLQINKLSLRELLATLGMEGPSGILTQFGELAGELKVESPQQLEFIGSLENFELYFSNRGVRGKQKVEKLNLSLALQEDRVSGLIDRAKILNGDFFGEISFNFDRNFQSGLLAVKIEKLGFSPSVQKLLAGEEMDPMGVFGSAQVRGGLITSWKGYLAFPRVKAEALVANDSQIKINLADDTLSTTLKVAQLKIEKNHPAQSWLRPLFLQHESLQDDIVIQKIGGRFNSEIKQRTGSWKELHGHALGGKVTLSSEGEWARGRKLDGVAYVDFPSLKLLKWDVTGVVDEIKVQPSAQMLRALAKKDPGLKLTMGQGEEERLKFFKNLVTNIREKMVDTAKKLVPQKGEN